MEMTISNMKSFMEKEVTTKDLAELIGKEHKHVNEKLKEIMEDLRVENLDSQNVESLRVENLHSQNIEKVENPNMDSQFDKSLYYKETTYQGTKRKEKTLALTNRGVNQLLGSYSAIYRDLIFDYITNLEKENIKLRTQKQELIESREGGKIDRRKFTDTIHKLSEYASEYRVKFENKKPFNAYMTYTKEIKRVSKNQFLRDDLESENLKAIAELERDSCRCILKLMKQKVHYKDIYKAWKQELQDIIEFGV